MKKIPVILDTDIGGDIDDTWALAYLLRCPELDLKLVTTATGDCHYRAKIIAKMLETSGFSQVPIGLGVRQPSDGPRERQAQWVRDYSLSSYPGKRYDDGLQAIIDCVEASSEPLTLISIAPLTNIGALLERAPQIAKKVNFVGMQGSFEWHHETNLRYSMQKGAIPEFNVIRDLSAAKKVFSTEWLSMKVTPLDTCAFVCLDGKEYVECLESADPMIRMVIENYRIWSPKNAESNPDLHSSVLYDVVAVYLAFSTKHIDMERIKISVDEEGYTVRSESGVPAEIAMRWTNLDVFKKSLVSRLCGGGPCADDFCRLRQGHSLCPVS